MSHTTHNLGPVMLDVVSTVLNADDIRRIQHPLTGGVILFARNYENRAQLTALTAAIHAARPGILIAVDHEGGRVQRFKTDGFTKLPTMRSLGALWDQNPVQASKTATAVGYVLAAELRACGVDLSFTPVLDLDYGASSVIGDRAFHRDASIVSALAKSLNHGLLLAGMKNCGKHFPGHGFVAADSHLAVPVDTRSLQEILAQDAVPYDDLGMSLSAVMPAHVIYPEVDAHPAGFSKKWLNILRHDMGFQGVIFSDDLSMEGASVAGDVTAGAHAALAAGCDMVLICNSPNKADQLLNTLQFDCNTETARSSLSRLQALLPQNKALSWDDLQENNTYQSAKLLIQQLSNSATEYMSN